MRKAKMLTSGEFAKLCRTTKETLYHYDREGLLKPKHISGNGYRRYGVEQFFDFDMIAMFKDTGSSLKEIKKYKFKFTAEKLVSMLEAKVHVVANERERLAQRQARLEEMVALTHDALDTTYDCFEVVEQDEEYLEVFPARTEGSDSTEEYVEQIVEYMYYYKKQGRSAHYPFGVLILEKDVAAARYKESFYFGRASDGTPHAQLHIKPKGRYAVLSHRGTLQSHACVYREMLRRVAGAGLRIAGNAYLYDMMSYIVIGVGQEYALRYCLKVEENRPAAARFPS